jgi:hypothetical protein
MLQQLQSSFCALNLSWIEFPHCVPPLKSISAGADAACKDKTTDNGRLFPEP